MNSIPKGILAGGSARAAALALIGILAASPALAYEHRTSTPSFGVQGGYGRVLSGDSFHIKDWPIGGGRTTEADFKIADVFNRFGPSVHIGLRFVLDRSHALGFGFDDLRYKRKGGYTWEERLALPGWLKFTTFHGDYYLYFRRRMKVSYYLAPFVGLQQRELRFKKSDIQSLEYRFLYGGSAGVEYFVSRSFSIDMTGRVFALKGGGGTNVVIQPALGFQVYVY